MYKTEEERISARRASRNSYMKKRYEKLKSEHRCIQCGKSDYCTTHGMTMCFECLEHKRIYAEKQRDRKRGSEK